jgi:hypothetical protein
MMALTGDNGLDTRILGKLSIFEYSLLSTELRFAFLYLHYNLEIDGGTTV